MICIDIQLKLKLEDKKFIQYIYNVYIQLEIDWKKKISRVNTN